MRLDCRQYISRPEVSRRVTARKIARDCEAENLSNGLMCSFCHITRASGLDRKHAQIAGHAVGRGLAALPDRDTGGPGLLVVQPLAAITRGVPQVVQVAVGDRRQTLVLRLAVDLELTLEDVPGGGAAQALMRPVHAGQRRHVLDRIAARKTAPPGRLDDHSAGPGVTADQPRALRPAQPRHSLHVAADHPLGAPAPAAILLVAQQALGPPIDRQPALSGKP